MKHMERFIRPEFIRKLLEIRELIAIEMAGILSDAMQKLFDQNGWSYNGYPIKV